MQRQSRAVIAGVAALGLLLAAPPASAETNCADSLDNDGNGLVDCRDPGCTLPPGSTACCAGRSAESGAQCVDGIDNDCDGTADCFDPACADYRFRPAGVAQELGCSAGGARENMYEADWPTLDSTDSCEDGLDNDGNGRTDCADLSCTRSSAACVRVPEGYCADGLDNDSDGNADCDDPDCGDGPYAPGQEDLCAAPASAALADAQRRLRTGAAVIDALLPRSSGRGISRRLVGSGRGGAARVVAKALDRIDRDQACVASKQIAKAMKKWDKAFAHALAMDACPVGRRCVAAQAKHSVRDVLNGVGTSLELARHHTCSLDSACRFCPEAAFEPPGREAACTVGADEEEEESTQSGPAPALPPVSGYNARLALDPQQTAIRDDVLDLGVRIDRAPPGASVLAVEARVSSETGRLLSTHRLGGGTVTRDATGNSIVIPLPLPTRGAPVLIDVDFRFLDARGARLSLTLHDPQRFSMRSGRTAMQAPGGIPLGAVGTLQEVGTLPVAFDLPSVDPGEDPRCGVNQIIGGPAIASSCFRRAFDETGTTVPLATCSNPPATPAPALNEVSGLVDQFVVIGGGETREIWVTDLVADPGASAADPVMHVVEVGTGQLLASNDDCAQAEFPPGGAPLAGRAPCVRIENPGAAAIEARVIIHAASSTSGSMGQVHHRVNPPAGPSTDLEPFTAQFGGQVIRESDGIGWHAGDAIEVVRLSAAGPPPWMGLRVFAVARSPKGNAMLVAWHDPELHDAPVAGGARVVPGVASADLIDPYVVVGGRGTTSHRSARLYVNDAASVDSDDDGLGDDLEVQIRTCAHHAMPGAFSLCDLTENPADTDHDGLCDSWEVLGVPIATAPDIPLPKYGANPRHKDLFVQVDWDPTAGPMKNGAADYAAEIYRLEQDFEDGVGAPGGMRARNPDGSPGINLHLDTGIDSCDADYLNCALHRDNLDDADGAGEIWLHGRCSLGNDGLGGVQEGLVCTQDKDCPNLSNPGCQKAGSDTTECNLCISKDYRDYGKDWYATSPRRGIFRWALALPKSGGGQASPDRPFFKFGNKASSFSVGGAFAHELGHTNGLQHAGRTREPNCKPNYPSIMNYSINYSGPLFFSSGIRDPLTPIALDEPAGLTELDGTPVAATILAEVLAGNDLASAPGGPAGNIDWNRDGTADPGPVPGRPTWAKGYTGGDALHIMRSTALSDVMPSTRPALTVTPPGAGEESRLHLFAVASDGARIRQRIFESSLESCDAPTANDTCCDPATKKCPSWTYPVTSDFEVDGTLVSSPQAVTLLAGDEPRIWLAYTLDEGENGLRVHLRSLSPDGELLPGVWTAPDPLHPSTPEFTMLAGENSLLEIFYVGPNGNAYRQRTDAANGVPTEWENHPLLRWSDGLLIESFDSNLYAPVVARDESGTIYMVTTSVFENKMTFSVGTDSTWLNPDGGTPIFVSLPWAFLGYSSHPANVRAPRTHARPSLIVNEAIPPHTLELFTLDAGGRLNLQWANLDPEDSWNVAFAHHNHVGYSWTKKWTGGPALAFYQGHLQIANIDDSEEWVMHVPFGMNQFPVVLEDNADFAVMDERSCGNLRGGVGDSALCSPPE